MTIRPLMATPPPTGAAAPAAPLAQQGPEDSAVLYVPLAEGGYRPFLKVPVQCSGHYQTQVAGDRHRAVAPDRRTLRVLDAEGRQVFAWQAPDYVQQAKYEPGSDRWFVRSSNAIHALDGATGQEVGRIQPERLNCLGAMELLSTGDLVLAIPKDTFEGGTVLCLGPDLQPKWTVETKVKAEHVMDLGHGQVAVFHDGEDLVVLDAAGQERLASDDLKLYSALMHEGQLCFLRSVPSKWDSKHSELVRYDPATAESRVTRVGRDAERIIPLPGGGVMMEEGAAGHPRVKVYDARGRVLHDYRFPDDRYLRQAHVSRDGSTALVVLGDEQHSVYRLDLSERASFLSSVLPGGESPPCILEQKEDLMPVLLEDGRVAVFSRAGLEVMDREGRDRQPARAGDLVRSTGVASRRVPTSYIAHQATTSCPDRWDAVLNLARGEFGTAAPPLSSGPFVSADDALNFALPTVTGLPWIVERSAEAARDLMKQALFREEGTTPATQAFPDEPAVTLQFARDQVKVQFPGGEESYFPGNGQGFSTALPVPGRRLVVATGEGRVQWAQVGRGGARATFDLGEPVRSLSLQDGFVLAESAGGSVLSLKAPGVAPAAPEAGPASGTTIEVAEDVVRIGGIVITRNR